VTEDMEVLRELMTSVYVTPRQRAALGRVVGGGRQESGVSSQLGAQRRASKPEAVSVLVEQERDALLGPCGAE